VGTPDSMPGNVATAAGTVWPVKCRTTVVASRTTTGGRTVRTFSTTAEICCFLIVNNAGFAARTGSSTRTGLTARTDFFGGTAFSA
jgi:hypothetical protein